MQPACATAMCKCSMGTAPSALNVLPTDKVTTSMSPAGTIMDCVPFVNVMPFGQCNSLANPATLAATVAAGGTLTPMPCTPVPAGPWAPGSTEATIKGKPMLTQPSVLSCSYAGTITITFPGQVMVQAQR